MIVNDDLPQMYASTVITNSPTTHKTSNSTRRSSSVESRSSTSQGISPHFMKPDGSQPYMQQADTFPFLSQMNPLYALPSYLSSVLIFSCYLGQGLPRGFFLSRLLTKASVAFFCYSEAMTFLKVLYIACLFTFCNVP
jgi:hypothetical protein